jgi:hypothetical protein
MPSRLPQIQERVGPEPKPEGIKASNIVHTYSTHRWPSFIQQHRQDFSHCCLLCTKARGHPCSLHRTPVRPRLRRVRCPRRGRQGRARRASSTVAYCLYEHRRINQATKKGLNRVSSVVEAAHMHPIGGVLNAEAAVRGRRAGEPWRLYPKGFRPEGRRWRAGAVRRGSWGCCRGPSRPAAPAHSPAPAGPDGGDQPAGGRVAACCCSSSRRRQAIWVK